MTLRKLITLVLFFIAGSGALYAQPSLFSKENFTNGKGDTLRYRLLYPDYDLSRKYPLVIFLHGSGERGNDNEAQLKWGVMNFATDHNMKMHPALVVAPQCPENQDWSTFRGKSKISMEANPTTSMDLLYGLIQQMIKTMPVDTNRIYITGLSMGGFGTFDALARYPKLFAAAVPVCGGGDPTKAATFAHVPTWIVTGSEDPAVPPQMSLDMLNALTKAGAKPGFTQYPETGHFSWIAAYSDEMILEWMFRQKK